MVTFLGRLTPGQYGPRRRVSPAQSALIRERTRAGFSATVIRQELADLGQPISQQGLRAVRSEVRMADSNVTRLRSVRNDLRPSTTVTRTSQGLPRRYRYGGKFRSRFIETGETQERWFWVDADDLDTMGDIKQQIEDAGRRAFSDSIDEDSISIEVDVVYERTF